MKSGDISPAIFLLFYSGESTTTLTTLSVMRALVANIKPTEKRGPTLWPSKPLFGL